MPPSTTSDENLLALPSKTSFTSTKLENDDDSGISGHSESIKDLIRETFGELAENMNDARVAELYGYALARASQWDGKDIVKRRSAPSLHVPCADFAMDCLDDLFPDFPDIEGLIRPDAHKGNIEIRWKEWEVLISLGT